MHMVPSPELQTRYSLQNLRGFSLSLHHTTLPPYLKSHHNQLNHRIKFVTSKKFRNWLDEIKDTKPYENPENGMDFYNNYKTMQSDTSQKMQKSHVIMSIRGLLFSSENKNLESIPFDDIKSNYEHLTSYTYNHSKFYNKKPKKAGSPITISGVKKHFERQSLFELRLIPAAKSHLKMQLVITLTHQN